MSEPDRPIRLLIADDDPDDRALAQELLAEGGIHADVIEVVNGEEALARLDGDEEAPDLLLTDLHMPKLDGLALVEKVRAGHPNVPVVVMTAYGSEEIAIDALHKGAASYVPKHLLDKHLVRTVRQVLEVSRSRRSRDRLLRCACRTETHFEFENDLALLGTLVTHLQENMTRFELFDEATVVQVGVALHEAVDNAIQHGNLEVPSDLRERDDNAYFELARRRRSEKPYCDRRVHITARETREEAVYLIEDEGPGFDVDGVPDPTDPANLEKVHGRGLFLIRMFMDRVSHNERGNVITLCKRRTC